MKYCIGLILIFFLVSCDNEQKKQDELSVGHSVIEEESIIEEQFPVIDRPSNVVTPEFWQSFDTDIEMVIVFHQGDSLVPLERNIVDGLKGEFSDISFHEFYTDDKVAQVFINDTLAFDITSFLMENEKGFVLLKPSTQPNYRSLNRSSDELKNDFHEFYGN